MKRDNDADTAHSAFGDRRGRLLRRILNAVTESHHHDMNRAIQRVIGQSDGHLTDELERRIAQRLMLNSTFF